MTKEPELSHASTRYACWPQHSHRHAATFRTHMFVSAVAQSATAAAHSSGLQHYSRNMKVYMHNISLAALGAGQLCQVSCWLLVLMFTAYAVCLRMCSSLFRRSCLCSRLVVDASRLRFTLTLHAYLLIHAHAPMPHALLPMPCAPCPMSHAPCPIPYAPCPIPHAPMLHAHTHAHAHVHAYAHAIQNSPQPSMCQLAPVLSAPLIVCRQGWWTWGLSGISSVLGYVPSEEQLHRPTQAEMQQLDATLSLDPHNLPDSRESGRKMELGMKLTVTTYSLCIQ